MKIEDIFKQLLDLKIIVKMMKTMVEMKEMDTVIN